MVRWNCSESTPVKIQMWLGIPGIARPTSSVSKLANVMQTYELDHFWIRYNRWCIWHDENQGNSLLRTDMPNLFFILQPQFKQSWVTRVEILGQVVLKHYFFTPNFFEYFYLCCQNTLKLLTYYSNTWCFHIFLAILKYLSKNTLHENYHSVAYTFGS